MNYGATNPVPVEVHTEALGEMVPLYSNDIEQWTAKAGMILRVLVGSTVHGTAIDGQDDIDEMGIAVEQPHTTLGLDSFEHYVYRTVEPHGPVGGQSVVSGPGDLDLIVYSLRKYAGLAARGNPTVLLPLFVPNSAVRYQTELGEELRAHRDMFLSRQAGLRFKGYMHSQREGLMGLRSGGTRNQGRKKIGGGSVAIAHKNQRGIPLWERNSVCSDISLSWITKDHESGEMETVELLEGNAAIARVGHSGSIELDQHALQCRRVHVSAAYVDVSCKSWNDDE